jgi:hypothetical protein
MNCPGSIALIGDESSTTNQAAMLGTAAHKLLEIMIIAGHHEAREYAGGVMLVCAASDEKTEYYASGVAALDPDHARPGWFMFPIDEKMIEGVQQTIDEVDRIKGERCEGTKVRSEVYLDGSWLDSRLGGTMDVPIIEPFGWLDIVDHKNGYVLVEAKDNDQLKQYAMLAAHEWPEAEGVTVTISQPNAPHKEGLIRSDSFSIDELKLYEIRVKEAADATDKPNAPLRAGDWCLWCPAKTRCSAYDAMLLEEARVDFADDEPPAMLPTPVSTEELAHKMEWVPVIEAWIGRIKADIQRELENGNEVPGWKLVRGRSKRRWLSTGQVQVVFVDELGIDDSELWVEPKMKSPSQLEKIGIGKEQRKLVKAAVGRLAFMPSGKLAIASVIDPREAVSALDEVRNEFADDDDDEDDFS